MGFRLLRFTNAVILIDILILTLTGIYGLFWTLAGWTFDVHRLAGWIFIACIPWKTAISLNSLRRGVKPDIDRGGLILISVLLATASLATIILGLVWIWNWGPEQLWLRQTAISWHWLLGLGLVPFFALHSWRRWPRPRKADLLSRRAVLKMATLGAASLVLWRTNEVITGLLERDGSPRRITGSRLNGYFSGNLFPITHGAGEGDHPVDPNQWRLGVEGVIEKPIRLTYEELLAWPAEEIVATIDCTLGWYSLQKWRGVPLTGLLEQCGLSPLAAGVNLESVTGYARFLPMAEAGGVLLATHVGDSPLEHSHGFPLRAIVPTRRGWYWVKWLAAVKVIGLPSTQGSSRNHALR